MTVCTWRAPLRENYRGRGATPNSRVSRGRGQTDGRGSIALKKSNFPGHPRCRAAVLVTTVRPMGEHLGLAGGENDGGTVAAFEGASGPCLRACAVEGGGARGAPPARGGGGGGGPFRPAGKLAPAIAGTRCGGPQAEGRRSNWGCWAGSSGTSPARRRSAGDPSPPIPAAEGGRHGGGPSTSDRPAGITKGSTRSNRRFNRRSSGFPFHPSREGKSRRTIVPPPPPLAGVSTAPHDRPNRNAEFGEGLGAGRPPSARFALADLGRRRGKISWASRPRMFSRPAGGRPGGGLKIELYVWEGAARTLVQDDRHKPRRPAAERAALGRFEGGALVGGLTSWCFAVGRLIYAAPAWLLAESAFLESGWPVRFPFAGTSTAACIQRCAASSRPKGYRPIAGSWRGSTPARQSRRSATAGAGCLLFRTRDPLQPVWAGRGPDGRQPGLHHGGEGPWSAFRSRRFCVFRYGLGENRPFPSTLGRRQRRRRARKDGDRSGPVDRSRWCRFDRHGGVRNSVTHPTKAVSRHAGPKRRLQFGRALRPSAFMTPAQRQGSGRAPRPAMGCFPAKASPAPAHARPRSGAASSLPTPSSPARPAGARIGPRPGGPTHLIGARFIRAAVRGCLRSRDIVGEGPAARRPFG